MQALSVNKSLTMTRNSIKAFAVINVTPLLWHKILHMRKTSKYIAYCVALFATLVAQRHVKSVWIFIETMIHAMHWVIINVIIFSFSMANLNYGLHFISAPISLLTSKYMVCCLFSKYSHIIWRIQCKP